LKETRRSKISASVLITQDSGKKNYYLSVLHEDSKTPENYFFRDCELGPIVNRDLSRRIRTVTGLTVDKKVVRNDIKLAAKIISNLDKRWDLWKSDGDESKVDKSLALFLRNIF